jgi:hypothetical protein
LEGVLLFDPVAQGGDAIALVAMLGSATGRATDADVTDPTSTQFRRSVASVPEPGTTLLAITAAISSTLSYLRRRNSKLPYGPNTIMHDGPHPSD